jgi:hypothetical protein
MVRYIRQLAYTATLLLVVCASLHAQPVFDTCAMEGSAVRADVRLLNTKKNRYDVPTDAQINRKVDFVTLLTARERPATFKEGDAVEIVAYVSEIKIGAVESVNCKSTDQWHRDSHIELTLDPMDGGAKEKLLVAEITPRFREMMKDRRIDWSQRALRDQYLGRWVKIRGWAFYDAIHDDESAGSGGSRIWRGSPWEIHPVTGIEVTTRPTNLPAVPVSQSTPSTEREKIQTTPTASRQCEGTTKAGNRCKRTVMSPARYCYQHQP